MTFAMREILKSKRALRERLAARPYAEKLLLLEQLREGSLAIARRSPSGKDDVKLQEEKSENRVGSL